MSRTVVDDFWGVRWTVRARSDRYVVRESEYTRREREPVLRAHLGPALAPHPGGSPALPWKRRGRGRDQVRENHRRVAGLVGALAMGADRPLGAGLALWRAVRVLNEPTDSFWVVELVSGDRIRRGATWRVADRAAADRVAAVVADALRVGKLPEPDGAQLIDVVDERLTVYGALR